MGNDIFEENKKRDTAAYKIVGAARAFVDSVELCEKEITSMQIFVNVFIQNVKPLLESFDELKRRSA